jgi:hypothetical protein
MALAPRDVVRIWDRHTRPNKEKLHICVCDRRQLFLRINSRPVFRPFHPLLSANNPFLHHDSFVELQQLVRHMAYEIAHAEVIGRMSGQEAVALVHSVDQAETLSEEHKLLIRERPLEGNIQ